MAWASSHIELHDQWVYSLLASHMSLYCFDTCPFFPWSQLKGCLRPSLSWNDGRAGIHLDTWGNSPLFHQATGLVDGWSSLCAYSPDAFKTLRWWASKPFPYIFTKTHYPVLLSFDLRASPSNQTQPFDPTPSGFHFKCWGFSNHTNTYFICQCICWRKGSRKMLAIFQLCQSR